MRRLLESLVPSRVSEDSGSKLPTTVTPKLTSLNQFDVSSSDDRACCCYGLPFYLMERMDMTLLRVPANKCQRVFLFPCRGVSLAAVH